MMNRTCRMFGTGLFALLIGSGLAACGTATSAASGNGDAPGTLQPVDDALAAKAQSSCWFKVKNRTSRSDEVRLWNASSSTSAKTERLGALLIVTGSMDPAVRDSRYYGCSLFEYTPGSPVVMMATDATLPVRADSVIPYGFARDGRKELK